jgi:hypothetical protein
VNSKDKNSPASQIRQGCTLFSGFDCRFARKNEPEVILCVNSHALDQVAPHGFLELRDFIRQFLQRGDEPMELPAPDALLPYLSRHPVAFFLCRLVNGNQGVVLCAVIILILSDPGVRGNEVLDGVGIMVQPLIQFLQRFFQFIRLLREATLFFPVAEKRQDDTSVGWAG